MNRLHSFLIGLGAVGVLVLLLAPNPAVGAPAPSPAGVWPPRAQDMVNVDRVLSSTDFSSGEHTVYTVPPYQYLVVTRFEVHGHSTGLFDWGMPRESRFSLVQRRGNQVPVEDTTRHSFCGWGGDLEYIWFNPELTGVTPYREIPGVYQADGVGLVFAPGTEVLLCSPDKVKSGNYNLTGYLLDS